MDREEYNKLLGRMQSLCSRSEKCRTDIEKKLKGLDVPSPVTEQILGDLEKESYIDEQRYARAYVNDKGRLQGWGPVKIANMLRMKDIPDDIIKTALSQVDENLFSEKLKAALLHKDKTMKEQDPRKRHARLVRFGLGKGYSFLQVIRTLEILKNNKTD